MLERRLEPVSRQLVDINDLRDMVPSFELSNLLSPC